MNLASHSQQNYYLRRIPMVRICLAFMMGILISEYIQLDMLNASTRVFTLSSIVVIAVIIGSTFLLKSNISSVITLFLVVLFGTVSVKLKPPQFITENSQKSWKGYIISDIKATNNFITFIARIHPADSANVPPFPCQVYVEAKGAEGALLPGSIISFKGRLSKIPHPLNPYCFDYSKYMAIKHGIQYQTFITSSNFHPTSKCFSGNLKVTALKWRQQLIGIIEQYPFGTDQEAILYALTLGYKDLLSNEIKQVFSNSGAMHVLAISGLHMGIFYIILQHLLRLLMVGSWKRYSRQILTILLLWLIAFITGFGASAIRGACMFSFFAISKMFRQQANIYNVIASSAFLMLLLNPQLLWNVSFQLSYAAVLGIVSLQPIFYSWLYVPNKIADYFYQIFTVSLAAQISTLPFTLFYFQQFPVYFALTNLLLIPLVFAALVTFILFLAALPFPILAQIVFYPLNTLLIAISAWVSAIDKLPFAVISDIDLPLISSAILAATIIIFISGLAFTSRIRLAWVLTGILLIQLIATYKSIVIGNTTEWVVFHLPRKHAILYRQGTESLIWVDESITLTSDEFRYTIKPYLQKTGSTEKLIPTNFDSLAAHGHLYVGAAKQMALFEGAKSHNLPDSMRSKVTMLIPSASNSLAYSARTTNDTTSAIILDGAFPIYKFERWISENNISVTNLYITQKSGAFRNLERPLE